MSQVYSWLCQYIITNLPHFLQWRKKILTTDNKLEEKYLFYCHDIVNFLKKVADLRSENWEDLLMLLQGDPGQHYTKNSINMANQEELEREERVRLPAAGFEFEDLGDISGVNSPHQKKRRRRSREEGIGGGL